jgi:hypothetical protein
VANVAWGGWSLDPPEPVVLVNYGQKRDLAWLHDQLRRLAEHGVIQLPYVTFKLVPDHIDAERHMRLLSICPEVESDEDCLGRKEKKQRRAYVRIGRATPQGNAVEVYEINQVESKLGNSVYLDHRGNKWCEFVNSKMIPIALP